MKRSSGLKRRREPRLSANARAALSKANPPRETSPPTARVPKPRNPGDNPTPPLPPKARCACGCGKRATHNHHVLYRQSLRRERADASDPRSCVPVAFVCHGDHHSGARRLPLDRLRDENYDFVAEVLGAQRAHLYLRRFYSGEDPRLENLLKAPGRGDQR